MSNHPPSVAQLDFFDSLTGESISPKSIGTVRKLPNGYWQAEIGGHWWVAQAKSKKSAINQVIKRYQDETERVK